MREEFFYNIKELIALYIGFMTTTITYIGNTPFWYVIIASWSVAILLLLVEYKVHDSFIQNGGQYEPTS